MPRRQPDPIAAVPACAIPPGCRWCWSWYRSAAAPIAATAVVAPPPPVARWRGARRASDLRCVGGQTSATRSCLPHPEFLKQTTDAERVGRSRDLDLRAAFTDERHFARQVQDAIAEAAA